MTSNSLSTIYPSQQYRDCPAALAWLVDVLGFTPHLIVRGERNRIIHAELRFGNGLVMVASANADGSDWLGAPLAPANVSLVAQNTDAVDAIHARVRASGARIVRELADTSYGPYGDSQGFSCLDAEGNRWSMGTYQPAARAPVPLTG